MKFDLEKALAGAPVRTKSGEPVEQLKFFSNLAPREYPVFGVIGDKVFSWTKNGHHVSEDIPVKEDLEMAPRKRKVSLFLNKDGDVLAAADGLRDGRNRIHYLRDGYKYSDYQPKCVKVVEVEYET